MGPLWLDTNLLEVCVSCGVHLCTLRALASPWDADGSRRSVHYRLLYFWCRTHIGTLPHPPRFPCPLPQGPVPACYFSSSTLQQLSVSDNFLSGPLPPVPTGCVLVELDVSANGPPLGPTAVNPGITVGRLLMFLKCTC